MFSGNYFFLFLFFKEVGAYAAQGALVIFGQLVAFVNKTANGTNKLFHTKISFLFFKHVRHWPVKYN